MKIKKLIIEFITVFTIAFVTVALVTFLWNLAGHGESTVDWKTSFLFAVLFGIILTRTRTRKTKEKWSFQKLNQQKEGINGKNHCIHNHIMALTAC